MNTPNRGQINGALRLTWLISAIMSMGLLTMVIACHALVDELATPMPEANRVLLRSLLYLVAIVTFPITNLVRHIQLHLNKTMPVATDNYFNEAKRRYLATVLVSLSLMESMGVYGVTLFMLGDGYNTLYIFVLMSGLGIFLYRPKANEFLDILGALSMNKNH